MLAKKWLWTIKILTYTEKQEAYVTDRGWVGGFQNGDNSHFCAKFFFHNLDWISNIQTCRYCAFMTQAKQNLIPSV